MADKKTILLVDNNHDHIEHVKEFLTGEGFDVLTSENSSDGFSKFISSAPHLSIVELFLPDLDGYELCEKMKRARPGEPFPVIMIAGVHRAADPWVGVNEFGPDAFIVKPFSFMTLMNSINGFLRGKKKVVRRASTAGGRFREIPFARLLYLYQKEKFSGLVDIEKEGVKKRLYFVNGKPIFVELGTMEESLGELLLKQEKISFEDYMYSVEQMSTNNMKQGEALLERKAITPEQLNEAIKFQTREKLLNLFSLDDANYSISASPAVIKNILQFDEPVEKIIRDGLDRYYTLERLNMEFSVGGDETLVKVVNYSSRLGLFNFRDDEMGFAGRINTGDTLNSVVDASRLNPFKSKLILFTLHVTEMISFR